VAPSDIKDTELKNGKTYHWCVQHKMWTLRKAQERKLQNPKDDTKKEADEKGVQIKEALAAI